MIRIPVVVVLLCVSQAAYSQFTGDIMLSYTVGNKANLGLASKSMYPFVAGINGAWKLSKKKYSPAYINLYAGARYSRAGMAFEGFVDTRPEYYKENNLSTYSDETNAKLVQNFINVPVGIEFKLNARPVRFRKINTVSLTILLNNAFLLSSQLDESVYSYTVADNVAKQSVDLKPYLESYYPGLVTELRLCTYFNIGFSWQKISYIKAEEHLDFEGKSASPFYEMVTDNGVYKDIAFYIGINIPLKSPKPRVKHAE
jgi:hypothetical protein